MIVGGPERERVRVTSDRVEGWRVYESTGSAVAFPLLWPLVVLRSPTTSASPASPPPPSSQPRCPIIMMILAVVHVSLALIPSLSLLPS